MLERSASVDYNFREFKYINHSKRESFMNRKKSRFGTYVNNSLKVDTLKYQNAIAELDKAVNDDQGVRQFNL